MIGYIIILYLANKTFIKEVNPSMNMGDVAKSAKAVRQIINPIDPLNIYVNFFDLFKLQKMKVISGDNFVVSNGILQCQNYFIPLDSVSIVEMARIQLSPWFFIGMFTIGIVLSIFNVYLSREYYVYFTLAAPVLIWGLILSAAVIYINTKLPYTMTIRLNNNMFCTYMNGNKQFIQKIMDKMQECINNRKGEYTFMLNQGKIEYKDNHSINIGGSVGRDFIAPGANKTTYENSNNTNTVNYPRQDNKGLTVEDWIKLEKFFVLRRQEFSSSDRNYKICNNLATYSQRKDAGKIKGYLQTIGKEGIRMLLSAGTNVVDAVAMETVKPILQKILSLKG